ELRMLVDQLTQHGKTGPCRCYRVLWEQWKDHETVDVRLVDFIDRFKQERMPCAHPHKRLYIPATALDLVCQGARLLFGQTAKRRSTPDLAVVAFRGFSPKRGDGVRNRLSQW